MALSFVLDYLARLWAPMSWLRPFSLFRYYEPQAMVVSGVAVLSVVLLAGAIVGALIVATVGFARRDL